MWFSGPVTAFPLSYIAGSSPIRISRLCRLSALPFVIGVMGLAAYFFRLPGQVAGVLSTSILIGGVVFGTYSSIYIANTVLVRLKVSQITILKEEDKNMMFDSFFHFKHNLNC